MELKENLSEIVRSTIDDAEALQKVDKELEAMLIAKGGSENVLRALQEERRELDSRIEERRERLRELG